MTLCSVASGVFFLLGIIAVIQPVIAEVSQTCSNLNANAAVRRNIATLQLLLFGIRRRYYDLCRRDWALALDHDHDQWLIRLDCRFKRVHRCSLFLHLVLEK